MVTGKNVLYHVLMTFSPKKTSLPGERPSESNVIVTENIVFEKTTLIISSVSSVGLFFISFFCGQQRGEGVCEHCSHL